MLTEGSLEVFNGNWTHFFSLFLPRSLYLKAILVYRSSAETKLLALQSSVCLLLHKAWLKVLSLFLLLRRITALNFKLILKNQAVRVYSNISHCNLILVWMGTMLFTISTIAGWTCFFFHIKNFISSYLAGKLGKSNVILKTSVK